MKALVTHGLWVLLVVAAYVAGTMREPGRSEPAVAAPGKADQRPSNRAGTSRAIPNSAGRSGEGEAWLEKYRGPGRSITTDRIAEAVHAILHESDPVQATLHFAQLLEELTPETAPAIFAALRDSGGSRTVQYLELLAHAWGRLDGPAALEAFATLDGRGAEAAKIAALAAWTADDPEGAGGWMIDRREDSTWARGFLSGLARRDVDNALQMMLGMFPEQADNYVGVLVNEKLNEGVRASADWALQLPGAEMRTNALETVGMRFLREDLGGAMDWAGSLAQRSDAHEAVADVADALATRDPAEAAAWVASLPSGPSQDHAYEDLFENWTRTDPTAAGQELATLAEGSARDTAVRAFSRTLVRDNPQNALAWAGTLSDTQERRNLQLEIARRWQRSAPAEAQAWVSANLPPDLQAQILPAAP